MQYMIVGAGPAGLQLAYFLEKRGYDYLVLEANDCAGSFFQEQPRHGYLLSLNKRYNGYPEDEFNMRHDWNSLLTDGEGPLFREYSSELYPQARDLVRYARDFAERHRLKIQYGTRVSWIDKQPDGTFEVTDAAGEKYHADRLIMGTGASSPYIPQDIEGIEEAAGYEDHDVDPRTYENKTVLVIGRGNSAFEVANHLAGSASIIHVAIGNRPIELAWETHSVRNLRAINNTVVEMLHVKALHGAVGLNVRKIRRSEKGGFDVVADEEVPNWKTPGILELSLHYDFVIRCTGFRYVTPEIFSERTRPKACSKTKYPVLDSTWQSSTPGLFYIGTAMAGRDKKAASSFIHGFRYNIRTLFHLLEQRFHQQALPSTTVPLSSNSDLKNLADTLLERLSTSAALYQQFGVLCDVLEIESGRCEIFRELPVEFVHEQMAQGRDLVLLTFEYGFHRYPKGTNPLSFITQMDETTSRRCAAYLHPVLRHYRDGELIDEDNLGESLTLRFSHHRQMGKAEPLSEDVERNTLMNIINRAAGVTTDVFSEQSLLPNHRFRAWPEGRPLNTEGLPMCSEAAKSPLGAE